MVPYSFEFARAPQNPARDRRAHLVAAEEIALRHPAKATARPRRLLLFRLAIVNLVALALLGAAWGQGWVGVVLATDVARLILVIAIVFLGGLALAGWRALQISRELDAAESGDPFSREPFERIAWACAVSAESRRTLIDAFSMRLFTRIAPVRHIANSLVFLGLIGTVIGFIIALSGVNPETAADTSAVAPMVSTLIEGMSMALYTTLVGAVLNIWLMVNYRLLSGATTRLTASMMELGERHARA